MTDLNQIGIPPMEPRLTPRAAHTRQYARHGEAGSMSVAAVARPRPWSGDALIQAAIAVAATLLAVTVWAVFI